MLLLEKPRNFIDLLFEFKVPFLSIQGKLSVQIQLVSISPRLFPIFVVTFVSIGTSISITSNFTISFSVGTVSAFIFQFPTVESYVMAAGIVLILPIRQHILVLVLRTNCPHFLILDKILDFGIVATWHILPFGIMSIEHRVLLQTLVVETLTIDTPA
jgi:hypothetical protein